MRLRRTKPPHARKPRTAPIAVAGALILLGFILPVVLALYLSADARPLGPRRVTDLIERFLKQGYDLEAMARGEARIPRLFLSRIPKDWRGRVPADKRKQAFVILVLPLILQVNERITADRQRLLDLAAQMKGGKAPAATEAEWLADLAARYDAKADDLDELTLRVDGIPPSLALAQAAMESGWGASRFATEGNALFGQWTLNSDTAMLPSERDPGARHAIRRFSTLGESVASYVHNLNTHRAYAALRKHRAALRRKDRTPGGVDLAKFLASYSERGADYVNAIEKMIIDNTLDPFDVSQLENESRPHFLDIQPARH